MKLTDTLKTWNEIRLFELIMEEFYDRSRYDEHSVSKALDISTEAAQEAINALVEQGYLITAYDTKSMYMSEPKLYTFHDRYYSMAKKLKNLDTRLYSILIDPRKIDDKIKFRRYLSNNCYNVRCFNKEYKMLISDLTIDEIKEITSIASSNAIEANDFMPDLDVFLFPEKHLPPL